MRIWDEEGPAEPPLRPLRPLHQGAARARSSDEEGRAEPPLRPLRQGGAARAWSSDEEGREKPPLRLMSRAFLARSWERCEFCQRARGTWSVPSTREGHVVSSVNARGARGQFRQRARGTWQFQELGNKACVVLWGLGGGRGVGVGWWGWVVGGGRGRRWVVGVGVLVGSGRWVLGMGPWALLGGGTRRLAPPAVTVM